LIALVFHCLIAIYRSF